MAAYAYEVGSPRITYHRESTDPAAESRQKLLRVLQVIHPVEKEIAKQTINSYEDVKRERRSPSFGNRIIDLAYRFLPRVHAVGYLDQDQLTQIHARNVANITRQLIGMIGYADYVQVRIASAALDHDLGKVYTPADVLNYPGKLAPWQLYIMQGHATWTSYILAHKHKVPIEVLTTDELYKLNYQFPRTRMEASLIEGRSHHEDGIGYPDGIPEEKVPPWLWPLIFADCYDGLRLKRPYPKDNGKYALNHVEAMEIIGRTKPHLLRRLDNVLPIWQERKLYEIRQEAA